MSEAPRIVAIMLVRNEDQFLRRAVLNIVDFCDEILIADHASGDGTPEIIAELARAHPKIRAWSIRHPRESNELLQSFVNTPTWIFAVDGDELYDPHGLRSFRGELCAGRFDEWWTVFGNVLNCVELEPGHSRARGYLAPPCRSMTKLYNFRMLRELDSTAPQRLHSHKGRDLFHPGFEASLRLELYKTTTWEAATFRCLHACFLPRSSREPASNVARENVSESLQPARRLRQLVARLFGRSRGSDYKRDKYMRGPLVSVDATPFFP
jgi:hypothetical protein